METNLLNIDCAFTSQYKGLLGIQQNIIEQLKNYPFDLSNTEITEAIIQRMDAFWAFNYHNNNLLGRLVHTKADDFFTDTCLLFFKYYFEQKQGFMVTSEESVKPTEGEDYTIRPDILIKKNGEPIAVIELKVSNGYKGKFIMSHLKDREDQFKKIHPTIFFGAVAFWNFFEADTEGWGTKYIGLKNYDKKNDHPVTGALVENLIREIEEKIKGL